jgi:hypothetical protein
MMAQGGGGHGMPPEQQQAQLNALTRDVGLTPDQATQVKAINADMMQKIMNIRNSGEDPSTARPKIMQIRTDQQAKIRALLTDEQKPKYDAYLSSRPPGRRPGGGAPGGASVGGNTSPPPQQ